MTDHDEAAGLGAVLLDAKFPGWEFEIDLESLDMRDPYKCVLAQVAQNFNLGGRSWDDGLRKLGFSDWWNADAEEQKMIRRRGFTSEFTEFKELTQAWKALIQRRLQEHSDDYASASAPIVTEPAIIPLLSLSATALEKLNSIMSTDIVRSITVELNGQLVTINKE